MQKSTKAITFNYGKTKGVVPLYYTVARLSVFSLRESDKYLSGKVKLVQNIILKKLCLIKFCLGSKSLEVVTSVN